jgi:glycine/D-amino acid oxidase-like deaminating enzyme
MDSMTDDVVVVGGRCAGAPTAMLLARAGLGPAPG